MADIVLPKVRLFVPCLDVILEPGNRTIREPLHTIRMPGGVAQYYRVESICFYAALTDGVGSFFLSVQLHNESGIKIGQSSPQPQQFRGGDQLNVKETRIAWHDVPFPAPGFYEFKLIANHAHLEDGGTANLRVLPG